jgi:hypothetical protein
MPLIPDSSVFQKSFVALPVAWLQTGETVFRAGSRTGRLMILKSSKTTSRSLKFRSPAPYSANSRFSWISRIRQMYTL